MKARKITAFVFIITFTVGQAMCFAEGEMIPNAKPQMPEAVKGAEVRAENVVKAHQDILDLINHKVMAEDCVDCNVVKPQEVDEGIIVKMPELPENPDHPWAIFPMGPINIKDKLNLKPAEVIHELHVVAPKERPDHPFAVHPGVANEAELAAIWKAQRNKKLNLIGNEIGPPIQEKDGHPFAGFPGADVDDFLNLWNRPNHKQVLPRDGEIWVPEIADYFNRRFLDLRVAGEWHMYNKDKGKVEVYRYFGNFLMAHYVFKKIDGAYNIITQTMYTPAVRDNAAARRDHTRFGGGAQMHVHAEFRPDPNG